MQFELRLPELTKQKAGICATALQSVAIVALTTSVAMADNSDKVGDRDLITSEGEVISKTADGTVELDEIDVTISNSRKKINTEYSTANSVNLISSEQINRIGQTSPSDVFKQLGGVHVGDSRNGGGADINIRGIQGQSRVKFTIDGAQNALDIYRGYAGVQQRSYFDPDLISSIKISKGPNGHASSASAVGGSVEIKTIGARDIVGEGKKFGAKLKIGRTSNSITPNAMPENDPLRDAFMTDDYGSEVRNNRTNFFNSTAYSGSATIAYLGENFELVGAITRRSQGNYFAGSHGRDNYRRFDPTYNYEITTVANVYKEREEVTNTAFERFSSLAKAVLRPSDDHQVEFIWNRFHGNFGEIMPSALMRFTPDRLYKYSKSGKKLGPVVAKPSRQPRDMLPQWPYGSVRMDSITLDYKWHPDDNEWFDFRTRAWWNGSETAQLNGSVNAPEAMKSNMLDYAWMHLNNNRYALDISNKANFSNEIGDFTLDTSASFKRETLERSDGFALTKEDLKFNSVARSGRYESFVFSNELTYQPFENLKLRAGGTYNYSNVQDYNRNYEWHTEKKRTIRWYFKDQNGDVFAYGDNFADANGKIANIEATPKIIHVKDQKRKITFNEARARAVSFVVEKTPSYKDILMSIEVHKPIKRVSHGLNPFVGLEYNYNDNLKFYANYRQAQRAPSIFESAVGTFLLEIPEVLSPETSRNIELGISTVTDDMIFEGDIAAFKLAYFRNSIEDYITRRFFLSDMLLELYNADSFTVSGLEFQADYDSEQFFGNLSASMYIDTETCDAETASLIRKEYYHNKNLALTPECVKGGFNGGYSNMQNPPKYKLSLTLGKRFFEDKLTVGSTLNYTSGPTNKLDASWQTSVTTIQKSYAPVTTLDAFASYRFENGAELTASASNLTDRFYLDPISQSDMPAPGRTFRANFSMKF
ncbi:TonB-dependent receptor domain-containing protein [Polycladidibacter stylochi]|uniref:TonB-dependent receptor domain-containing protein n=1 Tax=Polycladidibacter stylochi TaxID=1807766 RepID=UPI0008367A93|nr:TonB-dependent receptor [Pseudovibrio stylochi]